MSLYTTYCPSHLPTAVAVALRHMHGAAAAAAAAAVVVAGVVVAAAVVCCPGGVRSHSENGGRNGSNHDQRIATRRRAMIGNVNGRTNGLINGLTNGQARSRRVVTTDIATDTRHRHGRVVMVVM